MATRLCPSIQKKNLISGQFTDGFTFHQLNERRKAEILQYKNNNSNLSSKRLFARKVTGHGPAGKKVWATQNYFLTNPNIQSLPKPDGIVGDGPPWILICSNNSIKNCALTSSSDVPGRVQSLCYNKSIPLFNYIPQRRYGFVNYNRFTTSWKPGDRGFPRGKAGKNIVSNTQSV